MTPQDLQAAAAAMMSRSQIQPGGGANPAMQQQGGYGPMNRVTSRIPPVMPGQRIEEDMPQWDARSMGNMMGGPPPASGAGGPLDFGAILRRLIGNIGGGAPGGAQIPPQINPGMRAGMGGGPPIGNTGNLPGGDTTARGVPGDHIGLSELGQGSLLDQIVQSLQNSRKSQAPSPIVGGMR